MGEAAINLAGEQCGQSDQTTMSFCLSMMVCVWAGTKSEARRQTGDFSPASNTLSSSTKLGLAETSSLRCWTCLGDDSEIGRLRLMRTRGVHQHGDHIDSFSVSMWFSTADATHILWTVTVVYRTCGPVKRNVVVKCSRATECCVFDSIPGIAHVRLYRTWSL